MFDAFKIGVTVHLRNQARAGLHSLTGQFRKTGAEATRLTRQIETLKLMMGAGLVSQSKGSAQLAILNSQLATASATAATLGARLRGIKGGMALGAVGAGAGLLGLGLLRGAVRGGREYQEAITQTRMVGLTEKEQAEAVAEAWKNTGRVITASVAENINDLIEMRAVVGDLGHAKHLLPLVSKLRGISAALKWEGSANMDHLGRDMAKALDMLGKGKTVETMEKSANMLAQAMIWSKGMVNPESFRFLGKYSRQAKYGFSDNFLFRTMPKLIVDYASKQGGGGGHGGVGAPLAAFFRFVVQGIMNKESARGLQGLGLVPRSALMKTTTTGTTVSTGMVNKELALYDPFLYTHREIVPALLKKHANGRKFEDVSAQEWTEWVGKYFRGNQPAAGLILDFIVQHRQFMRDYRNTGKAANINDAYTMALYGSPNAAFTALSAQWRTLQSALTESVWPTLIPLVKATAEGMGSLARTMHEYPALTAGVAWGFGAIAVGLTGLGALATVALGFQLLGTAFGGGAIAAGIGAIAASFGAPVWLTLAAIAAGVTGLAVALGYLSARVPLDKSPSHVPPAAVASGHGFMFDGSRHSGSLLGGYHPAQPWMVGPPDAAGNLNGRPIVVHLDVDGRTLGRASLDGAAAEFDGPSSGASTFDPTMSIPATGQIGAS